MAPTIDMGTLPDVLKGVGALLVTITTAVVVPVAVAAWTEWRRRTKAMQSIPPTLPAHPFPAAPPTDPAFAHVQVDLLRNALKQAEWQVSDLRDEMALVRRDMAEVAADARRTAAALQAAQLKLDAANARIATLEGALEREQAARVQAEHDRDAADARARAAAAELGRLKAELGSTHSTGPDAIITPLLPGRR
jgi:hypothetical protein